MQERIIHLGMSDVVFTLVVEDRRLADRIEMSFADALLEDCSLGAHDECRMTITGQNEYAVYGDGGCSLARGLTEGALSFNLTVMFGERLRSSISKDECSLHASTVLIGSEAICFVGRSGSGKSTLSVIAAGYGSYVGDEYAVLNLREGTVRHPPYPIQIKKGSMSLFPWLEYEDCLFLSSEELFSSYLVPVGAVSNGRKASSSPVSVGAVVFPCYDSTVDSTKMTKIPGERVPSLVLPSVAGHGRPSALLKDFLGLTCRKGIPLISLTYSDGRDAADQLADVIDRGGI